MTAYGGVEVRLQEFVACELDWGSAVPKPRLFIEFNISLILSTDYITLKKNVYGE
jgi:hypothetical protein